MTQGYRKPRPVKDRIWEKVSFSGVCWHWTGATSGTKRDHGNIMVGSRTDKTRRLVPVHRLVYELYVGEIPEGFHVHHVCENGLCVRPSHLRAISPKDHIYQHDGPTAQNGRLTHCRKCGRELVGDNLIVERSSRWQGRRCKSCRYASLNAAKRERNHHTP